MFEISEITSFKAANTEKVAECQQITELFLLKHYASHCMIRRGKKRRLHDAFTASEAAQYSWGI